LRDGVWATICTDGHLPRTSDKWAYGNGRLVTLNQSGCGNPVEMTTLIGNTIESRSVPRSAAPGVVGAVAVLDGVLYVLGTATCAEEAPGSVSSAFVDERWTTTRLANDSFIYGPILFSADSSVISPLQYVSTSAELGQDASVFYT